MESFIGFSKLINEEANDWTFNTETRLTFTKDIIGSNNNVNLDQYLCPKTGTYFFTVTIATYFLHTSHTLQIDLKHDEDVVFRLKEESGNSYTYNMLSNSALVRCIEGNMLKEIKKLFILI